MFQQICLFIRQKHAFLTNSLFSWYFPLIIIPYIGLSVFAFLFHNIVGFLLPFQILLDSVGLIWGPALSFQTRPGGESLVGALGAILGHLIILPFFCLVTISLGMSIGDFFLHAPILRNIGLRSRVQ